MQVPTLQCRNQLSTIMVSSLHFQYIMVQQHEHTWISTMGSGDRSDPHNCHKLDNASLAVADICNMFGTCSLVSQTSAYLCRCPHHLYMTPSLMTTGSGLVSVGDKSRGIMPGSRQAAMKNDITITSHINKEGIAKNGYGCSANTAGMKKRNVGTVISETDMYRYDRSPPITRRFPQHRELVPFSVPAEIGVHT